MSLQILKREQTFSFQLHRYELIIFCIKMNQYLLKFFLIYVFVIINNNMNAQTDSALRTNDSLEIDRLLKISKNKLPHQADSSLRYANMALVISEKNNFSISIQKSHKQIISSYEQLHKELYLKLINSQKKWNLKTYFTNKNNKTIWIVAIILIIIIVPVLVLSKRYKKAEKIAQELRNKQVKKHIEAKEFIMKQNRQLEMELSLKKKEFESRKKIREKQALLHKQEKEIMKKQSETLQEKLEYKNKELTTKALFITQYNSLITKVIDELKSLRTSLIIPDNKKQLNLMINKLKSRLKKDDWKEFELLFNEVHSSFYDNLLKNYPNLSPNEKKLCAFLKLNLSTKDISAITYQNPNSINIARTRLRKKLKLDREENIISFLNKF